MPTKSRAPFGDTLAHSLERLLNAPDETDAEVIMMKHWEAENVSRPWLSFGATPLGVIIKNPLLESGRREPVSERDRQVVAATIQWLATNVWRCYYGEFIKKLTEAEKKRRPRFLRSPVISPA